MPIEATSTKRTPQSRTHAPGVAPGDEFTAVISAVLERWRVVAVLGIRVLAERVGGGERRSFTLRFVRFRLAAVAEAEAAGTGAAAAVPPSSS